MANLFKQTALFDLFKKIKRLDENKIFITIVSDKSSQKFIAKLNTDQLRLEFVNSDGIQLSKIGGSYSPRTVIEGNKKNEFSVDLYDEGDFHESFHLINITGKGFFIASNPLKDDGTNLLEQWGGEVEGLTFESINKASEFLLGLYIEQIRKGLGI